MITLEYELTREDYLAFARKTLERVFGSASDMDQFRNLFRMET